MEPILTILLLLLFAPLLLVIVAFAFAALMVITTPTMLVVGGGELLLLAFIALAVLWNYVVPPAMYVLRGFALTRFAKRNGLSDRRWMAWLPVFNCRLLGAISDAHRARDGKKFLNLREWMTAAPLVYSLITPVVSVILVLFLYYGPLLISTCSTLLSPLFAIPFLAVLIALLVVLPAGIATLIVILLVSLAASALLLLAQGAYIAFLLFVASAMVPKKRRVLFIALSALCFTLMPLFLFLFSKKKAD